MDTVRSKRYENRMNTCGMPTGRINRFGIYVMWIVLPVMILLSVCTGFADPVYAAPASGDIRMEVRAGYDDAARVGAPAPFVIDLENRGEEMAGEIQVIVDLDPNRRSIYAMPVVLPEGARKEMTLYVPIHTANRKAEVRVVQGKKVVAGIEYSFKKMISPNYATIGVLSDDSGALRELNGMKFPEGLPFTGLDGTSRDMMEKKMKAVAVQEMAQPAADLPAEVIRLERGMITEDAKNMNSLDILAICNFDTSTLSAGQNEALEQWIREGNMLFLGTGPNTSKVYSGLKDSLKPFKTDGSKTILMPEAIGAFIEKSVPGGDLHVSTGNIGRGRVILGDANVPLAVSYKLGSGYITVLTFDPALNPVSNWAHAQLLWQKLITAVATQDAAVQEMPGYNNMNPMPYNNYGYLASRVPEDTVPPFRLLLVMVIIYIVVAGPLIYLLLKWKDKRDWNWLAVPAAAFVFLGIIYIAGFKTRYTTAVLNTFSIIRMDSGTGSAETETVMAAFNNHRGDMRMEYDKNMGYEVSPAQNYYDYYSYSAYPENNKNARIVSKLTSGNPYVYELYDVRMWEPGYVYAKRSMNMEGGVIQSASLQNGVFKAVIKNISGLDFKDAFFMLGDSFIEVGDIFPGTEKEVRVSLDDPAVKKRYEEFMDVLYGQGNYQSPQQRSPDWREKSRKRNIFDNVFGSIANTYTASPDGVQILFVALNSDSLGYRININGKEPREFHTNVVYSVLNMNFEKGMKVEIPTGIIKPAPEEGLINYTGQFNSGIMAEKDGDIEMKFTIPGGIEPESIKVTWTEYMPLYFKYSRQQAKGPAQPATGTNQYEFFIYNYPASQWVKFEKDFSTGKDTAGYMNDKREVRVRVSVKLGDTGRGEAILGIPGIEIQGVVR